MAWRERRGSSAAGLHGPEGGTSCRAGFPAPDKAGIVPNKRRSPRTLSDKACRKGGHGRAPARAAVYARRGRSPRPCPRVGPFPGHFAIGKRAGPCPKQERRHIPGHAPSKKHLTLGGGLSMLRTCGPRGTAGRVLFPVCPCCKEYARVLPYPESADGRRSCCGRFFPASGRPQPSRFRARRGGERAGHSGCRGPPKVMKPCWSRPGVSTARPWNCPWPWDRRSATGGRVHSGRRSGYHGRGGRHIREFHEAQKERSWFMTRPDGTMLGQKVEPVDRAGCMCPAAKAATRRSFPACLWEPCPLRWRACAKSRW